MRYSNTTLTYATQKLITFALKMKRTHTNSDPQLYMHSADNDVISKSNNTQN